MNYPWLIIVGASLIGWLAVEFLAALVKGRVPLALDAMGAIAFACIAGGIVL